MDTAVRTIARPRFGQYVPGEGGDLAAVMMGEPGQPDYLLILHPEFNGKAAWKEQLAWAKALEKDGHRDFRLPTRRELHGIISNLKPRFEHLDGKWFWSCEPYGSDDAWCQCFYDGGQGWLHQSSDDIRGCAVRSVILQ